MSSDGWLFFSFITGVINLQVWFLVTFEQEAQCAYRREVLSCLVARFCSAWIESVSSFIVCNVVVSLASLASSNRLGRESRQGLK